MSRVFNFSAGPAAIPDEVLIQAQAELLDFRGTGMSVMEMSHRGKVFMEVAAEVKTTFASCWRSRSTTKFCSCRAVARANFL